MCCSCHCLASGLEGPSYAILPQVQLLHAVLCKGSTRCKVARRAGRVRTVTRTVCVCMCECMCCMGTLRRTGRWPCALQIDVNAPEAEAKRALIEDIRRYIEVQIIAADRSLVDCAVQKVMLAPISLLAPFASWCQSGRRSWHASQVAWMGMPTHCSCGPGANRRMWWGCGARIV